MDKQFRELTPNSETGIPSCARNRSACLLVDHWNKTGKFLKIRKLKLLSLTYLNMHANGTHIITSQTRGLGGFTAL